MFGVGAGVASLAVDGISNIFILRLLTQYLPVESAGYWILVTSAGSLLLLLQFGMGPTIARVVAGALGTGADSQLRSLLGAIRVAFMIIALLVVISAVLIFAGYLYPTAVRVHLDAWPSLGWFPYAVGLAANLQGQASLFVLNGYGEVGWDKVFRTVFTAAGFFAVWLALHFGAGLVELGFVYLVQHLLFWFAANRKMKVILGANVEVVAPEPGQVKTLFRDGSRLLLLGVLAYMISHFTIFVVERRFGIADVIGYTAMLRVGMLVGAIGTLLPQMLYPFVAKAWAAGEYARCKRYYLVGVIASVAIALSLCLPLAFLGREIFSLWLGDQVVYSSTAFFTILVFYLLYVHHAAHAMPALAVAANAFTGPAVVTAVSVVALILLLPGSLGLVVIPLGMVLGTILPSVYVAFKAWRAVMYGSLEHSGAYRA